MPQMAPISWLTLFIMFSITLIVFSTLNYYSFMPPTPKTDIEQKSSKTHSLNWKW